MISHHLYTIRILRNPLLPHYTIIIFPLGTITMKPERSTFSVIPRRTVNILFPRDYTGILRNHIIDILERHSILFLYSLKFKYFRAHGIFYEKLKDIL